MTDGAEDDQREDSFGEIRDRRARRRYRRLRRRSGHRHRRIVADGDRLLRADGRRRASSIRRASCLRSITTRRRRRRRPPTFHDACRELRARVRRRRCIEVGEGISFQIAAERAVRCRAISSIGADSHTVTLRRAQRFATGVGSSDLAAAMITGHIWLRVPETIRGRPSSADRPRGSRPKTLRSPSSPSSAHGGRELPGARISRRRRRRVVARGALSDLESRRRSGSQGGDLSSADGETEAYLAARTTRRREPVRQMPTRAMHANSSSTYRR